MITLPKPLMISTEEGNCWEPFEKGKFFHIHSILFDDGSAFDSRNGWRPQKYCTACMGSGRV